MLMMMVDIVWVEEDGVDEDEDDRDDDNMEIAAMRMRKYPPYV